MTQTLQPRSRGAALVLLSAGLLTILASFWTWGSCPTTQCGGNLLAISEYSGFEIGFGYVTAIAGLVLAVIGVDGLRRKGASPRASAAVLLALLVVATACASAIWMYVIPGDDKDYYWPPYTAILVGTVGLIAFVASLRLRRGRQVWAR